MSAVPLALDPAALDDMFRPGSDWAKSCGGKVRRRRLKLDVQVKTVASDLGVRVPTVYRIESGEIVPSDRMRVLLAWYLQSRPGDLWRYPTDSQLEALTSGS